MQGKHGRNYKVVRIWAQECDIEGTNAQIEI